MASAWDKLQEKIKKGKELDLKKSKSKKSNKNESVKDSLGSDVFINDWIIIKNIKNEMFPALVSRINKEKKTVFFRRHLIAKEERITSYDDNSYSTMEEKKEIFIKIKPVDIMNTNYLK